MPFIGRIVLCAFGCAIFGFGAFVYEDEEKVLQNRLEEWWVRLDDAQKKSSAAENTFLQRVFRASNFLIDIIFGPKSFSVKAALTSVSAAILGMWFWITSILIIFPSHRGPDLLNSAAAFWWLAAIPFLLSRFGWIGLAAGFVIFSRILYLLAYYFLTHHNAGFMLGSLSGLLGSI